MVQSEAQPSTAAFAAVPFMYDTPEAEDAQPAAPTESAPVLAVPDVAFVPSFAVPVSIQDHLPKTERMHKVRCIAFIDSPWRMHQVHCHCLHVPP